MSNRQQYVQVDTFNSPINKAPRCSVFQGSKMSGLLYSLYVNEVTLIYKLLNDNIYYDITNDNNNKFDPLTSPSNLGGYRNAASIKYVPRVVAFSEDLKISEVSKEIRDLFLKAIKKINNYGIETMNIEPDLKSSHYAFRTLRAFQFSTMWGNVLKKHSEKLKPEVIWNIQKGLDLKSKDLSKAEILRMKVRNNLLNFFVKYEYLITPSTPVAPNPVEERYVKNIDGIKLESYLDWLSLGYVVSLTGCPAISVPFGFSENGSPLGLQVIGKPYSEKKLINFASLLQDIFKTHLEKPIYNG